MSPTSCDTGWVAEEFDARAATYDQSDMHRWQADEAAAMLAPDADHRILDVATGTGLGARACARITGAPQRIVGIDVSAGMLRLAADASPGTTYVRADAVRLPFGPDTFDRVLCVAAVPYLTDVARAVAEWRRVGRPGAVLVFTAPGADGIMAHRLVREAAVTQGLDLPNPHAGLGTTDRIAEAVGSWGLTLDQAVELGYPDPLDTDPRTAFDQVVRYGFADRVRELSPARAEAVVDEFVARYERHQRAGTGEHRTRFTRCTFPG